MGKHTCPWCGGLPVADLSVLPQRAWASDWQSWTCEKCGKGIYRRFRNNTWTAWEKLGT